MNLKTYLESRHLTYKEFADLIQVNPCTVSNYICKKRKPALDIAIKIEKVTKGKVTTEELFRWWEETDEREKSDTR